MPANGRCDLIQRLKS